ncbi:MAG TPA: hypothetical protein VI233_05200, partial [Puia sp.]
MFPDRLCCFFAGIFIMLGVSCSHKRVVVPTYYYWRTETWVSQEEKGLLRKHAIPVLYTKVLDVDWAGVSGAIPVAGLDVNDINQHLNGYDSLRIQIVPVVFITNKTFSSIDSAEVPLLAKRVLRRCLPAYDSLDVAYEGRRVIESRLPARPREIQFDCDWTTKTAAKYFYFLQQVRQLLPSDSIRLSATIRLHQFKYPDKTGTPPVDRGMLMVYNVGDLKQYSPVNSIFEWKKAAAYFTGGKEYSLPLDIALPAYSWGLVFRDK